MVDLRCYSIPPVQGCAAFLVGTALTDCEDTLLAQLDLSHVEYHRMLMRKEWPDAVLWLERHDELGMDAKDERYARTMAECMVELKTFKQVCPEFKDIDFQIEMKRGTHWQ